MCDVCDGFRPGWSRWQGWLDLPEARPVRPTGEWTDLSHCLTDGLSRIPTFPQPTFRRSRSLPEFTANVTEIQMVAHIGTHLDAPCHFIADGPTADQVPLARLHGPGVVWRIEVPALGVIGVEHLERATPRMQRGDIVLIDTGWARHINTEAYEDHPALGADAAEWLVRQGAKIVAVDFSTPDLTAHKRPADFTWPVHQTLLRHGVLIGEHMTNLTGLAGRAVEVMFLGLNIRHSDGMPARVLARTID